MDKNESNIKALQIAATNKLNKGNKPKRKYVKRVTDKELNEKLSLKNEREKNQAMLQKLRNDLEKIKKSKDDLDEKEDDILRKIKEVAKECIIMAPYAVYKHNQGERFFMILFVKGDEAYGLEYYTGMLHLDSDWKEEVDEGNAVYIDGDDFITYEQYNINSLINNYSLLTKASNKLLAVASIKKAVVEDCVIGISSMVEGFTKQVCALDKELLENNF